jgi:hypothetical protein
VAKRTDVRNLFRKAASKNSLPDPLMAALPVIEPTMEEWFGRAGQHVLKSR